MHITKAKAIVALGAAAVGAVAAGTPASADDNPATPPNTVLESFSRPSQNGFGFGSRPLIGILDGSAVQALPWQFCGSDLIAGLGVTSQRPATMSGNCDNATVNITRPRPHHHMHPCDQVCTQTYPSPPHCPICLAGGSHDTFDISGSDTSTSNASVGIGATSAVPADIMVTDTVVTDTVPTDTTVTDTVVTDTVTDTVLARPGGFYSSGHSGGGNHGLSGVGSLLSVGSGSAITALPWQFCGSDVIAGLGATSHRPGTMGGNCDNATTQLRSGRDRRGPASLIGILDDSSLSVAPWQFCGSRGILGLGLLDGGGGHGGGGMAGSCRNASTILDR